MLRLIFISLIAVLGPLNAVAQHFQFSQYNYATQRINPALVASSDYAALSFLYRNQSTGGDFNLTSSIFSASYPLLNGRNGRRWCGLGVTLMDDRSGVAGIFNTQEAALSYAVNVYLSKWQTFSLGVKGLYQQQKINPQGLYTGMQYIPDRGFDESLLSGENFDQLRLDLFTMSFGLYWQHLDRNNNRIVYWSLSFFDFNKPQDSFLDVQRELRTTSVAALGLRMYQEGPLSVMPEVLYTRSFANNVFNAGIVTSYKLGRANDQASGRVDLITKYVIGRSGIVGIQFHKENFSVGFSYDFPVIRKNAGNLGALEFGLELRGLVDPRLRSRELAKRNSSRSKPLTPVTASRQGAAVKSTNAVAKKDSVSNSTPKQTLRENLQHKQDSLLTLVEAGKISHEALILEKVTLHFNFGFNSSTLDDESVRYLDELADALRENPHLNIKLIGHTDNIGSANFNNRLSLQRANTIKAQLVESGVEAKRIITEGKGMQEPLNKNETDEDRAENRRVELTIFYD